MTSDAALASRLEEMERLLRDIERSPESPVRERARLLVRAVLDLHTDALRRIVAMVTDEASPRVLDTLARDPAVAGVLLLHGLHPVDCATRVHGALDALAPALQDRGARVVAADVRGNDVHVRLERVPGARFAPSDAVRSRVEEAIVAAAPDVTSLEIEMPDVAAFVPLDQVRLRPRPAAAGE